MWIFVATLEGLTVIHLEGELDASTAGRLLAACAASAGDVEVDLVNLDLLDADGYSALMFARSGVAARGHSFRICNAIGAPAALLRALGGTSLADPLLEVHFGFTDEDARGLFPADG